jgi:site-specific recombinase XerD
LTSNFDSAFRAQSPRFLEEAAIPQKGTRLGNWLTREQAKELLAVPDRSTLRGKRDYVLLSILVGCALRRNELAELEIATNQQREGRWVLLADLEIAQAHEIKQWEAHYLRWEGRSPKVSFSLSQETFMPCSRHNSDMTSQQCAFPQKRG